ncbi:MAG: hypothetical protein AB7E97_15210, partial [Hydrogenophaga sp.]
MTRAQGDLHQAQEDLRDLRLLKEELGFAQRRRGELGQRLVEQDAAVLQLTTTNEMLPNKVDELLTAKQQLDPTLVTTRSSVTAQEQVVASILERFSAATHGADVAANPAEGADRPARREAKKSTGTGTQVFFCGLLHESLPALFKRTRRAIPVQGVKIEALRQ